MLLFFSCPAQCQTFLMFVDRGVVSCLGLIITVIFLFTLSFLVLVARGQFVGSVNPFRGVFLALLTIRSFINLLYLFAVRGDFVVRL